MLSKSPTCISRTKQISDGTGHCATQARSLQSLLAPGGSDIYHFIGHPWQQSPFLLVVDTAKTLQKLPQ
eukprot:9114055-Karenia_brevis.AAC.1